MKKFIVLIIVLLTGILSCKKKDEQIPINPISKEEITKILTDIRKLTQLTPEPVEPDEIAVIETTKGTIKFKFFPDVAPNHCAIFKMLANSGFYDGITFHRVIPNFVIQGGDILSRDDNPRNDGTGDPGFTINAEFSTKNHKRGIISTARKGNDINSASSQFFICLADLPSLDGQYSIFGEVTAGMDVVNKIANSPKNESNDRPLEEIIMKSVKVIKEK